MLLDSNIIIYAAQAEHATLRQLIAERSPAVSVISQIEVLGYHGIEEPERKIFEQFFLAARILAVSGPVVERAILLRQRRRIKLGDSIIAATALVHERVLITHNVDDFRWISELRLLDPLTEHPAAGQ